MAIEVGRKKAQLIDCFSSALTRLNTDFAQISMYKIEPSTNQELFYPVTQG